MPLTTFDVKGVPGNRRERIEKVSWLEGRTCRSPTRVGSLADPFRKAIKVMITGAHGFERQVIFAPDEEAAVTTERVRETFED